MKQEYKDSIKKQTLKNAEKIVDMIYDRQLLNPKLTRESIRVLEEVIELYMYSDIISHIEGYEKLEQIEKNLNTN